MAKNKNTVYTLCSSHLTVSHCFVVLTVGQKHVVQRPLQAGLRFALEEDVVREGPVHV